MARALSIDLGTKRVGFALSDPLKMIASPYDMVHFSTDEDLVRTIESIVKEKDVDIVIIGLPIREDGREGKGCEESRKLADKLKEKNITVVLWDERYSSKIAESILKECGVKQKNSKKRIDSLSASILLENYLQSLKYKE
ncbi:MAG: Holliday junction resolvase RuvX [Spirochaetales bacterium]|nr:Holliday junction resolvase RuvX [Spirochaetales bacterium]